MHLCIYYRFQQTLSFNPFDLFSILTRRESKKKDKLTGLVVSFL